MNSNINRIWRLGAASIADKPEVVHSPNSAHTEASYFCHFAKIAEHTVSSQVKNNMRTVRFCDLHEAVAKMVDLPHNHPFHVSAEVGHTAIGLLGILKNNIDVDAPQLLPTEGSTLAFVWEEGNRQRMLTLGVDELDLMDRVVGSSEHTLVSASDDDDGDLKLLIDHLGRSLFVSSIII